MTRPQAIIALASLLGAGGLWLMLPRGTTRGRALGGLLGCAALGLFGSQAPPLADWLSEGVFFVLSAVTLVAAGATISVRNPVYCAIWFALSLLGTAGLFLFQGAQFLGVATIVVYAGAILVTFLFVLMLAQPEGHAYYDRLSWERTLSALTGSVLVGLLTLTMTSVLQNPAVRPAERPAAADRGQQILAPEHMARLGAELFGRHLLAVEVAGTLLMVALVGTVAIVAHGQRRRGAGARLNQVSDPNA